MINDGNNGANVPNQPHANVQISAKEFASKFKSKRGKSSNSLAFGASAPVALRHAA